MAKKEAKTDGLQLVHLRNDFYRDNYQRIILAMLLLLLTILSLSGGLVYFVTHPPAPRYFAVDSNGTVVPLTPLDKPNVSKPAILSWSVEAATAALTFDFVNYRDDLNRASNYFTPEGWNDYRAALIASNNLKRVIDKKLNVSAVARGAPVILDEGVQGGVYTWLLKFPMLVTYQSANENTPVNYYVTIRVVRVPVTESLNGLGVSQFIAEEAG